MFGRGFGFPEILVVLVIILLLFGATKLPQLANSLGRSIREFKKGASGPTTGDETPNPKPTTGDNPPSGGPGTLQH